MTWFHYYRNRSDANNWMELSIDFNNVFMCRYIIRVSSFAVVPHLGKSSSGQGHVRSRQGNGNFPSLRVNQAVNTPRVSTAKQNGATPNTQCASQKDGAINYESQMAVDKQASSRQPFLALSWADSGGGGHVVQTPTFVCRSQI